jgi:condensin complex subunit 1
MSDDFNLQEELLSLSSDPTLYAIPSELDVPSLQEGEIDAHLSSAIETLVNDPDSLTHSAAITLDIFRSILKHSDCSSVSSPILTKALDAIISGLSHHSNTVMAMLNSSLGEDDVEAPLVHKAPLEIYAFLLQWFISIAEKGAGRSSADTSQPLSKTTSKSKKRPPAKSSSTTSFVWSNHLPLVLATMHKTLRLPTSRIWRTTSDRETFISCFTKPSYLLLESDQHLKQPDIKLGIYKTICLSVKFHNSAFGAQTSIIQNLTYFEHLSEPMAELLAILEKEFDYPQLGEEVLREVAGRQFGHSDAKGPRSFSRFLVRFGELSPRVVMKQMSLLLGFLDCEVSYIRPAWISDLTDWMLSGSSDENGYNRDHRAAYTRYLARRRR